MTNEQKECKTANEIQDKVYIAYVRRAAPLTLALCAHVFSEDILEHLLPPLEALFALDPFFASSLVHVNVARPENALADEVLGQLVLALDELLSDFFL